MGFAMRLPIKLFQVIKRLLQCLQMLIPLRSIPLSFFGVAHKDIALARLAITDCYVFDLQVIAHSLEPSRMSKRGFDRRLAGRHFLTDDVMAAGLLEDA